MSRTSLTRIDGPVAWIQLPEPARRSPLNLETMAELTAALEEARGADCRVLVLRSTGPAFSVGGDLRAFGAAADPGAYIDELAESLHQFIIGLHSMDAVVLSVVEGVAAGAGFPLAAAADIVIAAESATFALAYTKIGLTPDGGSSLLTSTWGLHRTMALALLNPVMTARQAHDAGLISSVHPDAELDSAVQDIIDILLQGSRSAQIATKRLIRNRAMPDAVDDLESEKISISGAAGSPDGIEGVRAFLEKRAPLFG